MENQKSVTMLSHVWASIAAAIVLTIICCGIYPAVVWGFGRTLFPHQANGSLLKADGSYTNNSSEAVASALIGQTFSAAQYFHPRPSAAGNGYDATASGGANLGPLSDKLINGVTNPATTQPTVQAESLGYDGLRLRTIHYALDNRINFKLYHAVYIQKGDGSITYARQEEVPLKSFQDAQGNLNDVALVDGFPHPVIGADAPAYNRTVLIAGNFMDAAGKTVLIPADAVTASASGLDPHISPANAMLQANRIASSRRISVDAVKTLVAQFTDGPDLGIFGDPGVNVVRLNLALDSKYPVPGGK